MAHAPAGSSTWSRAPGSLQRRTSRAVIVANEHARQPVELHGVAVAVWDALSHPRTTPVLYALVSPGSDRRAIEIAREVDDALSELVRAGIVVAT